MRSDLRARRSAGGSSRGRGGSVAPLGAAALARRAGIITRCGASVRAGITSGVQLLLSAPRIRSMHQIMRKHHFGDLSPLNLFKAHGVLPRELSSNRVIRRSSSSGVSVAACNESILNSGATIIGHVRTIAQHLSQTRTGGASSDVLRFGRKDMTRRTGRRRTSGIRKRVETNRTVGRAVSRRFLSTVFAVSAILRAVLPMDREGLVPLTAGRGGGRRSSVRVLVGVARLVMIRRSKQQRQ